MLRYELKNPEFIVVVIHGAREHIHRYDEFAHFLYTNNIAVYGIDHEGHGTNMVNQQIHFSDINSLLNDQISLIQDIKNKYPNQKIILFGHSLGTVYARLLLIKTNISFNKIILSGLTNPSNIELKLGQMITRFLNAKKTSKVVHFSMFEIFQFKNNLHKNIGSWLSYNVDNANNFISDPLCGGFFTNQAAYIFLSNIIEAKRYDDIPNIPHLLISGKQDPVTDYTKSVLAYEKILKKHNIEVENIIYNNMKHEILFETNKKMVYEDILSFING